MMREVYERRAIPAAWPRPDGLTALDIDKTTGYKATPFCPKDVHYIESFIPGTEPTAFCPIHSPFGAVGGMTGPMGGTGTAPDGAPQPTAPLPPGVARPAPAARARRRRAGRERDAVPESWGAPGRRRIRSAEMRARRLAARWVLPVEGPPIERGALLIGPTAGSSPWALTPRVPRPPTCRPRSSGTRVLLPGLINTHTHLELTGLDGRSARAASSPPGSDGSASSRRRARRRSSSRPRGAGLADCWAAGVTTVADTGDSGAVIAGAGRGGRLGDRLPGGLRAASGAARREPARVCSEQVERLGRYRRRAGAIWRLAPRAVHGERAALRRGAPRGLARTDLPLAVHLAESLGGEPAARWRTARAPFADAWRARGIPLPVAARPHAGRVARRARRAHRADALHPRRCRLGPRTSDRLARAGAAVAHCPLSNRAHGHGARAARRLARGGIRVGLGTDSVVSVGTAGSAGGGARRPRAGRVSTPARTLPALHPRAARAPSGSSGETGSLGPGKWGDCRRAPIRARRRARRERRLRSRCWRAAPRDVLATFVGGRDVYRTPPL